MWNRRPAALVEPTEHNQVRALQPRFEQRGGGIRRIDAEGQEHRGQRLRVTGQEHDDVVRGSSGESRGVGRKRPLTVEPRAVHV